MYRFVYFKNSLPKDIMSTIMGNLYIFYIQDVKLLDNCNKDFLYELISYCSSSNSLIFYYLIENDFTNKYIIDYLIKYNNKINFTKSFNYKNKRKRVTGNCYAFCNRIKQGMYFRN